MAINSSDNPSTIVAEYVGIAFKAEYHLAQVKEE